LGLQHKHQSEIASNYVGYKCESAVGYDEMENPINEGDTIGKVCTQAEYAFKYGFPGQQFTKDFYPHRTVLMGSFNPDSIM
jgi:hypothetical protein